MKEIPARYRNRNVFFRVLKMTFKKRFLVILLLMMGLPDEIFFLNCEQYSAIE